MVIWVGKPKKFLTLFFSSRNDYWTKVICRPPLTYESSGVIVKTQTSCSTQEPLNQYLSGVGSRNLYFKQALSVILKNSKLREKPKRNFSANPIVRHAPKCPFSALFSWALVSSLCVSRAKRIFWGKMQRIWSSPKCQNALISCFKMLSAFPVSWEYSISMAACPSFPISFPPTSFPLAC